MSARVLLVEDEPGLVMALSDLLTSEGYTVETATDGDTAAAKAASEPFDIIVLDVMLPGKSGFDVCRELRQQGKDVAVLMLTARTQVADRVAGLKLGADDYLTKPFEPPELLARIEALLRRVKNNRTPVSRFQFGDVEVDFDKGEATKGGVPVSLAGKELELLRWLINNRGKVVSRNELLEGVWEYQPGVSSRTVDVHIAWLRQKLEDNPQNPRHIHTVRGVGYRFSP
ncbi:MAG TPA: response regulator transcription factor [Bryobacteraceae bacterium]|nr:response regulator transcription factor [Bryobacteraceae bacterium]HOQ46154.1 response regulator transcription factor [Bryobacteraceae bacterium]HPQ14012.1 response regulator transcription factor [Bryobacteraceae bacterium]HPU72705.1 response regulator transcription factor [Bryobacteraceae bacterium]